MKLLIIGHTIPEPTTTAAGTRMMQLISLFQSEGYTIHFATSAIQNPRSIDLTKWGISLDAIQLNDTSFDNYIIDLDPSVVIFDRFVMEEHYGWRVSQCCPNAIKILDTEDLHFLRRARESAIKQRKNLSQVDIYTEDAKREIASIMRCDLSLIISTAERDLLIDEFDIAPSILHYIPFVIDTVPDLEDFISFEEREGFMTIGNYMHAPNVDSVLYLCNEIWPKIRMKLPKAKLYVYGNYAPQRINELQNEKKGIFVKGWAPSVSEVMSEAKVCLAPLRFGAGLKGKLLDAMVHGTPAVTTAIGAEGMYGDFKNAFQADTVDEFADISVALYTDITLWNKTQKIGVDVLRSHYQKEEISLDFKQCIVQLKNNLDEHRKSNFIGLILQHHTLQSTKYMSKWIEEKNKK